MTTTPTQPTATQYVVRCPDGEYRHLEPFDTLGAAVDWAEFGRCCLDGHAIEPVPAYPLFGQDLRSTTGLWSETDGDGGDAISSGKWRNLIRH